MNYRFRKIKKINVFMRSGSGGERTPLILNDEKAKDVRADGLGWFTAGFFMIGE
jgi:hypothetical protein